jgi:CubicO group peptidase (beta-lactamase class C family)
VSLDEFLRKRILEPLNMKDTYFVLPVDTLPRLARLYKMDKDGKLIPAIGYFFYPEEQKYFSGGAGLVSTATDYSRFAQMLLNGGELDGKKIFSSKTVKLMTSNSIGNKYIWTSFAHNGITIGVRI